jgi:hypothetical protein
VLPAVQFNRRKRALNARTPWHAGCMSKATPSWDGRR